MISKQKYRIFDKVIQKWQEVLCIRGALFAIRKGKSVLQVQLDAFLIERMDQSLLYEGFSNFHLELMMILKDDNVEVEYVKISGFDITNDVFWTLAAQSLEER